MWIKESIWNLSPLLNDAKREHMNLQHSLQTLRGHAFINFKNMGHWLKDPDLDVLR